MSMNILNDISAVYLEQVSAASRARNAVADDRLDAEQEKTNASMDKLRKQNGRFDRASASDAARRVEGDVKKSSAYGPQRPKPGTVTGRRIEETVIDEAKKRKIKRWWDDDGDDIGYEEGEVSGKFKRKKVKESSDYDPMDDDDFDHDEAEENRGVSGKNNPKGGKALGKKKKSKDMKEGFSNWRQDLSEVMDDIEASKEIKEKKNINNKVKTSAMGGGIKLGEAVEQLGGELIEMVEVDKKELELIEKAESEQQQKLFGLALSVKRGDTPRSEVSDAVLKIVDTMSEKKIRDFAKTKHKGLPQVKEDVLNEREHDEPGEGVRQTYGDTRKIDRSGLATSFGGKWQSKERKAAGAAALAKLTKDKKVEEQMEEPMEPAVDKQAEMLKKKNQMQKVKELTTRLQSARKGVY